MFLIILLIWYCLCHNQGKIEVVNQFQRLRERISKEGAETKVRMFISLMQSLRVSFLFLFLLIIKIPYI